MTSKHTSLLTILAIAMLLSSLQVYSSFSEKHQRSMGASDLIAFLNHYFPEVAKSKIYSNDCFSFQTEALQWGTVQPSLGEASYKKPAAAFLGAMGNCLKIAFDFYDRADLEAASAKNFFQRFWPESLWQLKKLNSDDDFKLMIHKPSTSMTDEEKLLVIRHLIKKMIGPEKVLLDFGFVKSQSELEQKILVSAPKGDSTVNNWMAFVVTILVSRDEFLKY